MEEPTSGTAKLCTALHPREDPACAKLPRDDVRALPVPADRKYYFGPLDLVQPGSCLKHPVVIFCNTLSRKSSTKYLELRKYFGRGRGNEVGSRGESLKDAAASGQTMWGQRPAGRPTQAPFTTAIRCATYASSPEDALENASAVETVAGCELNWSVSIPFGSEDWMQ